MKPLERAIYKTINVSFAKYWKPNIVANVDALSLLTVTIC